MADFDPRAQVVTLLSDIGLEIGMSDLALDDEDRCVLGFGDAFAIDLFFHEARATILITTIVGELEPGDRAPILTEMLRANLYGVGTEGATLSLGPEDHVLLHRELPVDERLDVARLRQALDSLGEVTVAWNTYLENHQPDLDLAAVSA